MWDVVISEKVLPLNIEDLPQKHCISSLHMGFVDCLAFQPHKVNVYINILDTFLLLL